MLRCPKCGYDGPFSVLAEYCIMLHADGENFETPPYGSVDWDNYNSCCCPKCDYEGTVGDFENG